MLVGRLIQAEIKNLVADFQRADFICGEGKARLNHGSSSDQISLRRIALLEFAHAHDAETDDLTRASTRSITASLLVAFS